MKRKKFLEYKHHKILMGLLEQRDPGWVKTNKELEERAWAGEDKAFFQLLERNPDYLKTNLAMSRIMEWRFTVQMNRLYYLEKGTLLNLKENMMECTGRIYACFSER